MPVISGDQKAAGRPRRTDSQIVENGIDIAPWLSSAGWAIGSAASRLVAAAASGVFGLAPGAPIVPVAARFMPAHAH